MNPDKRPYQPLSPPIVDTRIIAFSNQTVVYMFERDEFSPEMTPEIPTPPWLKDNQKIVLQIPSGLYTEFSRDEVNRALTVYSRMSCRNGVEPVGRIKGITGDYQVFVIPKIYIEIQDKDRPHSGLLSTYVPGATLYEESSNPEGFAYLKSDYQRLQVLIEEIYPIANLDPVNVKRISTKNYGDVFAITDLQAYIGQGIIY